MGLLSRFVGMLTDSRSFLSFPRHEYFRRILCGIFGRDIAKGLVPNDTKMIGKIIQDISFNNAKNYFPFPYCHYLFSLEKEFLGLHESLKELNNSSAADFDKNI